MVLSGLIFMPLLAIPTLALLKKNFQIKLFYALVTFVHFVFSLGLFTKHGYLFDGVILEERINLFKEIGLSYTVSLGASAVLFLLVIDFIFLIFGTLGIKENGSKKAILLSTSHTLVLITLTTTNLLLSVLALFLFSIGSLFLINTSQYFKKSSFKMFSFGASSILGVCLTLAILYESIYGSSNLDMKALLEMRTPFVRGSLYSTQFVLFAFFHLGFGFFAIGNVLSFLKSGLNVNCFQPLIGIFLSSYLINLYSSSLFPEAYKFYFPSLQNQKALLIILLLFFSFLFLTKNSIKLFLERPRHV